MTRILFVCLGNICRSPLAEAAMRSAAADRGIAIEVDSAGTGNWHAGEAPDSRAIATASRHGIDISGLRARQIRPEDLRAFDHVVALDRANLRDIGKIAPADATGRLSLLLDHAPERQGQDVADPYFGGMDGFETAWADIGAGVTGLLDRISAADSAR